MTQSTSLYNTGVEVTTADTIVTLSTCTSASDNHRFVVRGGKRGGDETVMKKEYTYEVGDVVTMKKAASMWK